MRIALILAISLVIANPALAQSASKAEAAPAPTSEFGVPVFPYDITDRPYQVIGEVEAGVRKATVFSKSPSQEKIYRELWERAQKLGADAVIKAQYGEAHITAMSWGKTNATGIAIKFLPSGSAPATPPPATK